jgi:hypothetical protein
VTFYNFNSLRTASLCRIVKRYPTTVNDWMLKFVTPAE